MVVPKHSELETGSDQMLIIHTFGVLAIALHPGQWAEATVVAPASKPLKLETRTIEALLVYLAYHERPISRDLLAELLWPERTQTQAQANLRLALHRLRRQLDPFLFVTRQSVGLNPQAAIALDARRFETLLTNGQLEQATSLYHGDFLADFYLKESPAFEQWALLERERLRTLALAAWQQRIEQLVVAGEPQTAIECAQRLLQLDPLHEATHRQLMRLLAQNGQRSAALAQYETCRHLLATELAVTPDETTTALAEQIRTGELRITSYELRADTTTEQAFVTRNSEHVIRHNLPPQSTPLIGRGAELAQIAQLLSNPDCRLLTLLGVGGIGKTRLALASATRQADDFRDGIYFVDLAALEESELVTVAIARSLGLQNSSGDLLTQVAAYLRSRELLLILDNFEQIIDAAAIILHLLRHAPRLKILATSRQRLALLEEWLLPVGGLSSQAGWDDDAGQLFVRSAQRVQPAFLAQGQEEQIAAICRLVEGMPLALEVAASWSRVMPCAAIVQLITTSLDFLTTDLRNLPERHRSLRALFAQSWRLLSSAEQQTLRRVSVFRGGWTLEEAVAVAATTLPTLVGLVDKSLVRTDPQGRFAMHELVRQSAAEQLATAGEGERIRRLHFTTYLQLVRKADSHLRGAVAAQWYARLDAESDNIRAAWEWALATDAVVDAGWLGVALSHYWNVRLYFHEAVFWLEQILPHRQRLPHDLRLATLLTLYQVWRGRDDFQSIDRYMSELVALQEASANHCLRAIAWRCMGVATADYARAITLWEQCIRLLRQSSSAAEGSTVVVEGYCVYADRTYQLAFALFRYAIRLIDAGEYDAAEQISTESLTLFRRQQNRDFIVYPLGNLGRLALLRGDLTQARLLIQEAIATARTIGNVMGLLDWLPRLGVVTLYSGNVDLARQLLHESLQLSRTITSAMYLAWSYTYLAETALWQGEHDQAAQWLAQALTYHANPRWVRTELVDCLWVAARLATAQQQYQRAATLFGLVAQVGQRIRYAPVAPVRSLVNAALATVQAALEPAAFAEAFATGQQMTPEQAFATILAAPRTPGS